MKKITLILILLCAASTLLAQKRERYDKEKLESARVAFITNRINLTSSQAEKFWPLFNEHMDERRKLMREITEISRQSSDELSDQKASELLDKRFDLQEEMLKKEKSFMEDIIQVISPVQALQLTNVNREFTRHLYRMQRNPDRNRHKN